MTNPEGGASSPPASTPAVPGPDNAAPEAAGGATAAGSGSGDYGSSSSGPTPDAADPPQADPPQVDTSQADTSQADTRWAGTAPTGADTGATDSQATTQLPATGWGSDSSSSGGAGSGPSWSSDETRNFPTYQPQSYPTYPPTQSNTSALPAVSAGGPPPTTAAAYGGNGPATAATFDGTTQSGKPRRRDSAGFAGALGLIGLSAAAVGALGLPIELYAQNQNAYFGTYRDLAARKITSNRANQHSISLVGGRIATDWWRYGVYITLGALALLFLIKICVPVLRRVAGVLLFLGGLAGVAGFLLGAHQTNDYRSVTQLSQIRRISWQHLAYGFWVAVAGCVVVALAGLIATLQSTRR